MTRWLCLFALALMFSGCGYHVAGPRFNGGKGLTIAVPTFLNRTTSYRIEQRMSDAVRRELVRSTRFSLASGDSADMVANGEVLSFNANPVIFDTQGRGTSYTIIIDMKIVLTDTRTKKIAFQVDRTTFREVFELSEVSSQFDPEDVAAMDRLSLRFARWFVQTVMNAKT